MATGYIDATNGRFIKQYTWKLTVLSSEFFLKNNTGPIFLGEVKDIVMKANDIIVYELPPTYDYNGDQIITVVKVNDCQGFVEYSSSSFSIRPTSLDIGACFIDVTLSDVNTMKISTPYRFKITVKPEKEEYVNEQTPIVSPDLKAKIHSISPTGEVLIKFSKAVSMPDLINSTLLDL